MVIAYRRRELISDRRMEVSDDGHSNKKSYPGDPFMLPEHDSFVRRGIKKHPKARAVNWEAQAGLDVYDLVEMLDKHRQLQQALKTQAAAASASRHLAAKQAKAKQG